MRTVLLALAVLISTGCDQEQTYDFRSIDAAGEPGASLEIYEDAAKQARREIFYMGGGEQTPLADYLFVVDGSSSMHRVMSNFRRGFRALAREGAFPEKARIGVISTLPGHPEKGALDPAVAERDLARIDPGFQRLVSKASIARYRETPGADLRRFPFSGCNGWFAPGERNAEGVPCMLAHSQVGLVSVGVEAGLTAAMQFLMGETGFRPGAAINVVFVSDTHDPGLPEHHKHFERLVADRPTFAELERTIATRHTHSGFKVHAIAPESECGELWSHIGPSYFEAAKASGGQSRDICSTDDYTGLIRDVIEAGREVTRPVFPLSSENVSVSEVLVDGSPASFTVVEGGSVVVIEGSVPDASTQVEVTYGRTMPTPSHTARPVGKRGLIKR